MGIINRFIATPSQSTLPAHKTGRQTSYDAKGMVPNPQDSGLEMGSSMPTRILELVPELVSPYTRRLTYASMQNDAGVDVSLRTIKTPVLGAEFYVDQYSDDPNDLIIADFIEDNLMGGMSAPFVNSIEDILRFFEDGYSLLEKVYELRSWAPDGPGANAKNYTMLEKFGVRPESTISKILYDDNGGLASVDQIYNNAAGETQNVTIPVGKLLAFTFNRRGGDITGRSILRTAYPHWYYKTHLYKIDAIQKERHSLGIPKGKLLPGYTDKDKNVLRTLLRNLRTNEESFLMLPPAVDVEFAEVKGNLVNVLESAEHHNAMIMLNVMGAFLSNTTGRAASATQFDMFMKALRYIANYIADVINMYVIPELVIWNFPTTNFPKLCVKNVGETRDLQMLASAIANMLAQGGITPDIDTENFFRRTFDIPAKQPNAQPTVEVVPAATANQNGNGNAPQQTGNIKNGKGTGNIGKPTGAAASVLETLPQLSLFMPPQAASEHSIEFHHDTPIEVDATSRHEHDVDLELKLEEGAIQHHSDHHITAEAPTINIHMPETETAPAQIKQVKPKAAVAKKLPDGSTRIEYEYEAE